MPSVMDKEGHSTTASVVHSEEDSASVQGLCKGCKVAPSVTQVTDTASSVLNKQGRPVSDRVLSDEKLVEIFREKLRLGFHKIEERFRSDKSRTDKYRTMLVRLCKRVLGEVMGLIGIDSYAKSN